jgi:hypothetical protein
MDEWTRWCVRTEFREPQARSRVAVNQFSDQPRVFRDRPFKVSDNAIALAK